jgi:hypothetical protein
MGGAQAAAVNDASALVANPAALRRLLRPSASLLHATYAETSFFDYAGFGRRVGRDGAFGAGAQFLSQGDVEQIDVNGNTTGNLTPNDLALSLGYAREVSGVCLGVGGKYIRSKLVDTASAFALDAGILSPLYSRGRLRWAAVLSNLGPSLTYGSKSQSLPTQIRGGAAFAASPRWDLALDAVFPNAGDSYFAMGAEYHLPFEGPMKVSLRGGYNNQSEGQDTLSGFSGGLGFAGKSFGLDYALVTQGDLGLSHRFSLNFRFGPETKLPIPKTFPSRLPAEPPANP